MLALPDAAWTAFCQRIRDEHAAGWLTRAYRDVALAIARHNAAGDWNPTVARIALDAVCTDRTVRRARACLEARGLLAVKARFEIVDGRAQQRSNAYGLVVPDAPVVPKPRIPRGGQRVRPIQGRKEKMLMNRWPAQADRVALAALAARRAVIEGRMRSAGRVG